MRIPVPSTPRACAMSAFSRATAWLCTDPACLIGRCVACRECTPATPAAACTPDSGRYPSTSERLMLLRVCRRKPTAASFASTLSALAPGCSFTSTSGSPALVMCSFNCAGSRGSPRSYAADSSFNPAPSVADAVPAGEAVASRHSAANTATLSWRCIRMSELPGARVARVRADGQDARFCDAPRQAPAEPRERRRSRDDLAECLAAVTCQSQSRRRLHRYSTNVMSVTCSTGCFPPCGSCTTSAALKWEPGSTSDGHRHRGAPGQLRNRRHETLVQPHALGGSTSAKTMVASWTVRQRIARSAETRAGLKYTPPRPETTESRANSRGLRGTPNTIVARLRHHKQADEEAHRRHRNRVDQGTAHAAGRQKCGGGDEWHQAPAPTVADVVGHGNGRVADSAWKILCQERPDRAVHHADVGHQDEYDEDRGRIVDCAGVGDFTQPTVQRVIRQRCQQHSPENDRLAADVVGEPSEQNQSRGGDEQRNADDVAGGQHVELFHRLQEVEGPELAAVPHHALPEQNHDSNQNEFDVGAQECLFPRISYHPAPGLHLLENRSFPQLQPDVDRHDHQQERDEERNPPAPCVESLVPQVSPGTNDHREGNHDAQRRGRLQPAGVVAPALIRNVLGNVRDRAAVFSAQAQPLDDSQAEQNKGSGNANRGVGGYQADGGCPQAHSGQSHDEGVFAAHPVTQISEQKGAQWTNQEAGGKQGDRAQQRRHRVGFVEELDRQDRGQTTKDVEVVPFDDVAYGGGDHYTAGVLWDLPGHSIPPSIRLVYERKVDCLSLDNPPRRSRPPCARPSH